MKKSILLISMMTLFIVSVHAQQVYKSGGTSFSTFLFSYPSYAAKSQSIFLPSDLTNTMSGNITTLYYKYGDTIPQTLYNYTIKMGQTTATSFGTADSFFTGLTTVLSTASFSIPTGINGNWFSIPLTTPFAYDATKTLIIQFTFSSVLVGSWGTLGTSNTPVKKMISPDTTATTGDPSSGVWQDMGFDLAPVSVMPVSSSIAMNLFPNPCQDKLTIYIPGNKPVVITLVNNLGEEILKKEIPGSETTTLDVTKIARGIYFVKAKSDEKVVMRKVVLE